MGLFSSRLNWNLQTNRLSDLLGRKRRAGGSILDLTESNPTQAGFDYPPDLVPALADERALRYDPSPAGLISARKTISEYYGNTIDPAHILLTASTSEAYAYLFKLLADPGDEVLVPRPSYPLFEYLAMLESAVARQYSLRYDGAWHIDFESLSRRLTPRTRAIVVVNPNNPTGSFLKQDELERLESLQIPIISDEVFSAYEFGEDRSRVHTLAGPRRVLTFSMSGLSKIAALPQMKLGWIAAAGPAGLAEEALDRLEVIADTYLSVATPAQWALPELLAARRRIQRQILDRITGNLHCLDQLLSRQSLCARSNIEAGWSAILRAPGTLSDEERALELLDKDGVLVHPGHFFDFGGEGYLVVSLLPPPAVFREGISRMLARITA